jgi:hypothetical protein
MDIFVPSILIIIAILVGIILDLWLGLLIKPGAFAPYPQPSQPLETIPLSASQQAPVERFYKVVFGKVVPVIKTVVIEGAKLVTR